MFINAFSIGHWIKAVMLLKGALQSKDRERDFKGSLYNQWKR